MKKIVAAILSLLPLVASAKPTVKAPVEYAWNDGDSGSGPAPMIFVHLIPGGALTLKLVNAQGGRQKASANSKSIFPNGLDGETCRYRYRPKIVIAGENTGDAPKFTGPGFRCLDEKMAARPAFCPCPLIRKNLNATFY